MICPWPSCRTNLAGKLVVIRVSLIIRLYIVFSAALQCWYLLYVPLFINKRFALNEMFRWAQTSYFWRVVLKFKKKRVWVLLKDTAASKTLRNQFIFAQSAHFQPSHTKTAWNLESFKRHPRVNPKHILLMSDPKVQFESMKQISDNKELLNKCERGNKLEPLLHKCQAKQGTRRREGVQLYCPSSTCPAILLLVSVLYFIA